MRRKKSTAWETASTADAVETRAVAGQLLGHVVRAVRRPQVVLDLLDIDAPDGSAQGSDRDNKRRQDSHLRSCSNST